MSFDLFVETLDFSLEKLLLLRRKQITEKRHQLLFFFQGNKKKIGSSTAILIVCVCVCVSSYPYWFSCYRTKSFETLTKDKRKKKNRKKEFWFDSSCSYWPLWSFHRLNTKRSAHCIALILFPFSPLVLSLSLSVCVGCPICSRLGSADCSLLLLLEKQLDKEENSFVVLFSLSLLEWIDPQFSHHFLPAPPSTPNQWTVCPARDFSFLQLCSSYDP